MLDSETQKNTGSESSQSLRNEQEGQSSVGQHRGD